MKINQDNDPALKTNSNISMEIESGTVSQHNQDFPSKPKIKPIVYFKVDLRFKNDPNKEREIFL